MTKIDRIIEFIDKMLIELGSYITPPEANKLLAKAGLLNDSKLRPGLPLRRLLPKARRPTLSSTWDKIKIYFAPSPPKADWVYKFLTCDERSRGRIVPLFSKISP